MSWPSSAWPQERRGRQATKIAWANKSVAWQAAIRAGKQEAARRRAELVSQRADVTGYFDFECRCGVVFVTGPSEARSHCEPLCSTCRGHRISERMRRIAA